MATRVTHPDVDRRADHSTFEVGNQNFAGSRFYGARLRFPSFITNRRISSGQEPRVTPIDAPEVQRKVTNSRNPT